MPALAEVIEQREWEVASVYLLMGLAEALSRLPKDAVVGLIDVVEGGPDEKEG